MQSLGKLMSLNPRNVWKDEARDFTPWLAENLAMLGEALELDLELTSREADVGGFSLDLLAKDLKSGKPVVVENQFGTTNHDHLGKVLTYASGFDARAVVWVAEKFREEHRQALDWLNQHTDSEISFFGVRIEVLQIDNSLPAISLKLVVYPNPWQKSHREAADKPASARSERYRAFFQGLIDELRERHRFTNARAGQPQNWYSFSTGVPGFQYSFSFALGNRLRAELYIDLGDGEENEAALEWLRARKGEIENVIGAPLSWEPLEDRRACRIAAYRQGSIDDSDQLESHRRWAIEMLLKFKAALGAQLEAFQEQHDEATDSQS